MPRQPWYQRMEEELIEEMGGTWESGYGVDGTLDGAPVEVRLAKTEDRFRLNKGVHRELVRDDGAYIFDDVDDDLPPKVVDADEVSDILGRGSWHSDRGYEHRFIDVDDIF